MSTFAVAQESTEPKKHVVILGAGASITSGYPDANRLAILMCDPPTFWRKLYDLVREAGWDNPEAFVKSHGIEKQHQSFIPASRFLREGDYATMDELSNLAKDGGHANQIRELKKLMRFVFALNNPHTELWAKSDYRKLIQSVFDGQSHLRSDFSIISFNYDPYFEYRLAKALRSRTTVRPVSEADLRRMELAATSGFINPADSSWLNTAGFCHLKLHGAAALPIPLGLTQVNFPPKDDEPLGFTSAHLIGLDPLSRFTCLSDPRFADQDPPALLPWEIISTDGKLLEESQFEKIVGRDWQHRSLYPLFRALWLRARAEIQEADKVSFVGMSIGAFMEPELRYLFEGKIHTIQLVVANKENEKVKDKQPFHPHTCCGKVLRVINKICPNLACVRSSRDQAVETSDDPRRFAHQPFDVANRATPRNDFADFIQNEL